MTLHQQYAAAAAVCEPPRLPWSQFTRATCIARTLIVSPSRRRVAASNQLLRVKGGRYVGSWGIMISCLKCSRSTILDRKVICLSISNWKLKNAWDIIVVHSLRHLEYQLEMIQSRDVVLTSHPLMRVETFQWLRPISMSHYCLRHLINLYFHPWSIF